MENKNRGWVESKREPAPVMKVAAGKEAENDEGSTSNESDCNKKPAAAEAGVDGIGSQYKL